MINVLLNAIQKFRTRELYRHSRYRKPTCRRACSPIGSEAPSSNSKASHGMLFLRVRGGRNGGSCGSGCGSSATSGGCDGGGCGGD